MYHNDPASRAATLTRLAAAGVVIHVADADTRLGRLLDPELHRLMSTQPDVFDADQRELHCIRMRRAALQAHSSWARDTAELPWVSILLTSRRPWIVARALTAVTRQTYPRLELVLTLHGNAEEFAGIDACVAAMPLPVTVVRVPGSATLGSALNAAVAAASGTLLSKIDDDDLYGVDHVWDLVLAREYSGAELVGKATQFVYLAASNRTVHIRRGQGESYRRYLAGGTLLIARSDLDRIGGWRNVPHAVDTVLEEHLLQAGGGIYTTHGAGFMLVRHGRSHTWETGDDFFLRRADRVVPGWVPAMAGLVDESDAHFR